MRLRSHRKVIIDTLEIGEIKYDIATFYVGNRKSLGIWQS